MRPLNRDPSSKVIIHGNPSIKGNTEYVTVPVPGRREYEKEVRRKYNLSPHYQYVRSKFHNVAPIVEKLRRNATERKLHLQNERTFKRDNRCPEFSARDKPLINIEIQETER